MIDGNITSSETQEVTLQRCKGHSESVREACSAKLLIGNKGKALKTVFDTEKMLNTHFEFCIIFWQENVE